MTISLSCSSGDDEEVPASAAGWRTATIAFATVTAIVMAMLSFDYGISWDEPVQDKYGQLVFAYYRSGFTDRSALDFVNLYLYGGLFELACAIAERLSPLTRYDTRHLLNALAGCVGFVYAARIAASIRGWRAAFLTFLFLALSPQYFGNCMNNSKDIPFASAYAASVYYVMHFAESGARSRTAAVKALVAIGSAIGVRFGGLLLIAYLWMAVGLWTIARRRFAIGSIVRAAALTGLVSVGAVLLGDLFCPWALQKPFVRPFEALAIFARFPADRFRVLFGGQVYRATQLPHSYIPVLFSITTPIAILVVGLASALLLGVFRGERRLRFAFAWFAFAFPPAYVMVKHAPIYGGIHHLLFSYLMFVPIAAVGSDAILGATRGRPLFWIFVTLLAAGLADSLRFSVVNHPHQAVYFNALGGGMRGAFARYDLDYQGNSAKAALEWIRTEGGVPAGEAIRVSGPKRNAFTRAMGHYLDEYDRFIFTGWNDPPQSQFDVDVLQGDPASFRSALERPRLIHAIQVDGVPICVIRAGRNSLGRAPAPPPDPAR